MSKETFDYKEVKKIKKMNLLHESEYLRIHPFELWKKE